MSTMNIYCCGGSASNIGAEFIRYSSRKDPGFAEIHPYFIDASRSNITSSIPDDIIYLADNLDGSGKLRNSNYDTLSECSRDILHQFKPVDINVVLHSASGGTGSVVGPLLVSELLSRGQNVVVVVVGSSSSRIETENTIKTLKSYEMISHRRELPVNLHYRENSTTKPRGVVDTEIQTAIVLLAAIFSGSNKELDGSDLSNFINYHRVTSYTPKLSYLEFFSKDIILGKGQSLISLVTLVDQSTSSDVDMPVDYQAVGFLPTTTKEAVPVELPIHACVISGYFNAIIDTLTNKLSVYDEARKVVIEKAIISKTEDSTSEGLIL